jgi:Uma2 family endonuclease
MSTTTLITAEQLLRMPQYERGYELVAGEIRKMTPTGGTHGVVTTELAFQLRGYVKAHGLGRVLTGEPGFILARDPDTVLAPDVAFVRKERLAAEPIGDGFVSGPPDLAVEVLSPGDRMAEAREKAKAWLAAGAAMVWVVNPARRTVTVYRPSAGPKTLTEADELDGQDVVPGFRCRVAELFVL